MSQLSIKTIANNKKAFYDYFILETYEAGIQLFGTEVKSIRLGRINLKDAYCFIKEGELYVRGMHISPYEKGNIFNKDPIRERKLLMNRREINRLYGKMKQDGCAIIPLKVYLKGSLVKLEIALTKGKKDYDKRQSIAERDAGREIERAIKNI